MLKSSSKFPPEVACCFWSYDPEQLDLARDRKEIVTQVLNYGGWESVKWIRGVYSDADLKEVFRKPARGRWFKETLNFWLLELGLTLDREVYERALFRLDPTPELTRRFFLEVESRHGSMGRR